MTTAAPVLIRAASPPAMESWPLGALDRVNVILTIRGTWLFRERLDAVRLQEGLSRLLSYYPHLAGRMERGERIRCHNEGIPFRVVFREDLDAVTLDSSAWDAETFADRPNQRMLKQGRQAPMAIRLTQLAEGSILSVCASHALLDGHSFFRMIRDWSELCRGETLTTPPLLDPSRSPTRPLALSKEEAIQRAKALGYHPHSLWKMLSLVPRFLFGKITQRQPPILLSPRSLDALRAPFAKEDAAARPSTHAILAAFFSEQCAVLLQHPKGTPCQQAIVLNLRERIADLPASFVGNAAYVLQGARFSAGTPWQEIAHIAHNALAPLRQRPSLVLHEQIQLALALMHYRAFWLPYDMASIYTKRPTTFYINDFTKMPIYDLNFGSPASPRLPIRAIPHNLPDPLLFWPAPPDLGGIEVYLTGFLARAAAKADPQGAWSQALQRLQASSN